MKTTPRTLRNGSAARAQKQAATKTDSAALQTTGTPFPPRIKELNEQFRALFLDKKALANMPTKQLFERAERNLPALKELLAQWRQNITNLVKDEKVLGRLIRDLERGLRRYKANPASYQKVGAL